MGALLEARTGKVLCCLADLQERQGEQLEQQERRECPLDAHGVTPGLLTLNWLVSARAFRKNFIISKYVEKKYAKRSPASQCPNLPEAVKNKDIFSLLQAYAENMDLSEPVQAPLQVWHLVGGTIIRGTKQGTSTRGSHRQLCKLGLQGA